MDNNDVTTGATKTLSLTIGQHTQAGRKDRNEDFFGAVTPDEPLIHTKGAVMAIADGISGCEAGKEASECTVKGFLNDYLSTPDSWTVVHSVEKVLQALNQWLYARSHDRYSAYQGMLTTLSAVVIKSTTAHLVHVGDSRIYLLRDGQLEQLTTDHRIWISAKQNHLSRAMGADLHLDIDYRSLAIDAGDILLFTTDGVHDYIGERRMVEIVERYDNDLDHAAREITNEAYANDSPDNLTCQVVRLDRLPEAREEDFYRKLTELPFPPDLEPGMTLDGYRIIRELRASNRSQVYLALEKDSGRQVVIKTPSVNFQDDPLYIDQFLHEEWVGKRLSDAHVMKIFEPAERRRFMYYAAEYIEGQTLREWMHDNPAPSLNDVRAIIKQVAAGLRSFHRMEMLHQDLKPENIMIDTHGTVKIIDFGSARIAGLSESGSPISHDHILGTRDYSAPEYLSGERGTNRSDIYSLGVIAYEMFTSHLPHGKSRLDRPMPHRQYISARNIRRDLPVWIDGALRKATRLSPDNRYELLSEFIFDLEHPNPSFTPDHAEPLIKRNPLLVWKGLTFVMLIFNIFLLYLLAT